MLKKALRFFGYWSFFWCCFLFFAYHTFPYERVRDRIVHEVEFPRTARGFRRPSGYQLEIQSLSPSWLTGVELRGVHLTKALDDPSVRRAADVTFEEINARVSLISLLLGDNELTFDAMGAGGTIEDGFVALGDTMALKARLVNLNFNQATILRGFFSLPIRGEINGTIDVTLPEDPRTSTGSIDLSATNVRIGDGRARLKLSRVGRGFPVERINAGRLRLELQIEEGVAEIIRFRARGPHVRLDGTGRVNIMRPIGQSRLDALVRLQVLDAYGEQNPEAARVVQLLRTAPPLASARTSDNSLQWRLGGSFRGGLRRSGARNARMEMPDDDEEEDEEEAAASMSAMGGMDDD